MTLELYYNGYSKGYCTFFEYTLREAISKLKADKGVKYKRNVEVWLLNNRFQRIKRVA